MRVLYVEDRETDEKLFTYMLEVAARVKGLTLEIECARNLDNIHGAPLVDIILLDAQLNGGAELTFEWVRVNASKMPAIFMLSGTSDNAKDCIRCGAQDFMDKGDVVKDATKLIERMILAIERHRSRPPI